MAVLVSAKAPPLYEQLLRLPENVIGEIINGRLYTQPRPTKSHTLACASLEIDLGAAYQKGRGGPGGWWILVEPEIHFIRDTEVLVPDLAGWRRERLPSLAGDHRFEVVPDWVCEILSPKTARMDRDEKMPIYAHYGVPYLWLVDPKARVLEVFERREPCWTQLGLFQGDDTVRAVPFQDITIALQELWPGT
jgi:Uma2 family endonuclease